MSLILIHSLLHPHHPGHYEAIAFGAIPITELDPDVFTHFKGAPIVYNNSKWVNVTESYFLDMLGVKSFPGTSHILLLEQFIAKDDGSHTRLPLQNLFLFPAVNRNMIFEEYWMEYVDSMVGRPLQWWDRKDERHATIKEMNSGSH